MEKHPLESWDQLIYSGLRPDVLPSAPEGLNAYLTTATELKEAVRTQLLRDTLYIKTEKEIELLVERYQNTVASLLDLLYHYQHYESINQACKDFYGEVAGQLEAILLLLQASYSRYFNQDQHLPLLLRLREGHELKKQWKSIYKTLGASENDRRLITILEGSFKGLLHPNEQTTISYRQVAYFKNLLEEISTYLSATTPPVYASLTELLICWKFNDMAFTREVCTGIRTEMEKKESDEFRLEFLKSFFKQVSQLTEKNSPAFHADYPTAKQLILDWVSVELAYMEGISDVLEKKRINKTTKINTSLSVPSLALFIRLFKDSGIFTNTNQTEIFKFFSAHFTIGRKSEFSHGYLHSKYFQIDEGTKKKVYDYLMVMAQLCKKL